MTTNNNDVSAVKPPMEGSDEAELAKLEKEANEAAAKLTSAEGDETPSSESAPVDEKTTPIEGDLESEEGKSEDGKTPEGDPSADDDDPEEGDVPENLSPKAQKRFKKLAEKAKKGEEAEAELARLKSLTVAPKLPDFTLGDSNRKNNSGVDGKLPWEGKEEEIEGEGGITIQELDQRIQQKTQEQLAKIGQFQSFVADVKSVETEYPVLNADDKDHFDPDLASKISRYYESIALIRVAPTKDNPDGALVFRQNAPTFKAFVSEIMGIRAKSVEEGKKTVTSKVLKQAAQQPVSSTGATPSNGNKSVEDQIKDPNTSLEDAEALANKAVK